MNHTRYLLALLGCLLLAGCAGMTEAQTAGVVVSGASALGMFVKSLVDGGLIPPEKAAQLSTIAESVHTTVDAVNVAVRQVAESFSQLKAQQAETWTGTEVASTAGGVGLAATALAKTWATAAVRRERGEPTQKVGLPADKVRPAS